MTEQYGQPSINLQSSSPTTIYIRGLSDLDNFAPADLATGERRIFTPAGSPGVELRIEGQIQLPDGQYILDDVPPGPNQGVTFTGRSANLDGLSGNVDGPLIIGTNGANMRQLTLENESSAGACIQVGDLLQGIPAGIPEFRTSVIEKVALLGKGGGILLSSPQPPPLGATIGMLIQDITSRCSLYAVRMENFFTAGVRIQGLVNINQDSGLEAIQVAIAPPASGVGPIAIRGCSFFVDNGVPGDAKAIVFDDVSVIGTFAIEGCGFEVADPADAIYDNATAGAVTPGAGPAADLISRSNVLLDSPPVLITQNPV
jgi:hypothetical protein